MSLIAASSNPGLLAGKSVDVFIWIFLGLQEKVWLIQI